MPARCPAAPGAIPFHLACLTLGRLAPDREIGGMALMALTVDDSVSDAILEEVKKTTGADLARTVNLEK